MGYIVPAGLVAMSSIVSAKLWREWHQAQPSAASEFFELRFGRRRARAMPCTVAFFWLLALSSIAILLRKRGLISVSVETGVNLTAALGCLLFFALGLSIMISGRPESLVPPRLRESQRQAGGARRR